jgi:hypothetical protein
MKQAGYIPTITVLPTVLQRGNYTMSIKQIHIEKYDFDAFEKEQKPFVMVLTHVIQNLPTDRADEFAMWVYLESLPPTWKINKHHLMERFDISSKTYERRMEWLNTVKLIEYRQIRNSSGHFGKGKLVVLNGTQFNLQAESTGTVKIDGTAINKKKSKVIHNLGDYRTDKIGDSVKSSTTHASYDESSGSPNRQFTEVPSNDAHINTTKRNTKERKKTNKEKSVSVFSDTESVKNHIDLVITNRKAFVEDDIIQQGIYYSFLTNEDKSFDSVNKRINIFLKKVRLGEWLTPQGFNGITSQSIREKEEKAEAAKREQYKEEARAAQTVFGAVTKGEGLKSFSEMFQKLKAEVNE